MNKSIKTIIKLQIQAGKANPAPPVGPALGQHGLNIMDFCNQFNTVTKERGSEVVPVDITVFEDNSFEIKYKTSPAADLLKKAAGVKKGSGDQKAKIGRVAKAQIREIAEKKLEDLNANDMDAAEKIIAGTAKNMGLEIVK